MNDDIRRLFVISNDNIKDVFTPGVARELTRNDYFLIVCFGNDELVLPADQQSYYDRTKDIRKEVHPQSNQLSEIARVVAEEINHLASVSTIVFFVRKQKPLRPYVDPLLTTGSRSAETDSLMRKKTNVTTKYDTGVNAGHVADTNSSESHEETAVEGSVSGMSKGRKRSGTAATSENEPKAPRKPEPSPEPPKPPNEPKAPAVPKKPDGKPDTLELPPDQWISPVEKRIREQESIVLGSSAIYRPAEFKDSQFVTMKYFLALSMRNRLLRHIKEEYSGSDIESMTEKELLYMIPTFAKCATPERFLSSWGVEIRNKEGILEGPRSESSYQTVHDECLHYSIVYQHLLGKDGYGELSG